MVLDVCCCFFFIYDVHSKPFLQYFSKLFVLLGFITDFLDTPDICSLKIKKVSFQSCLLFTLLFNINWVSLRYSDESHIYVVDSGHGSAGSTQEKQTKSERCGDLWGRLRGGQLEVEVPPC